MGEIARVHDVSAAAVGNRVGGFDWSRITSHLDAHGWALLPTLLTTDECSALAGLYGNDPHFRKLVTERRLLSPDRQRQLTARALLQPRRRRSRLGHQRTSRLR